MFGSVASSSRSQRGRDSSSPYIVPVAPGRRSTEQEEARATDERRSAAAAAPTEERVRANPTASLEGRPTASGGAAAPNDAAEQQHDGDGGGGSDGGEGDGVDGGVGAGRLRALDPPRVDGHGYRFVRCGGGGFGRQVSIDAHRPGRPSYLLTVLVGRCTAST